ncbi:MAG: response regulator [Betaproteobacteria bacterium]
MDRAKHEKIEILLVEDRAEDLELTLRAFTKAKFTNNIFVVRDGAVALDFLFCRGDYADRDMRDMPRLVLLDLKLPKVDGLEVLRQLKSDARTRVIPVVMLTSSAEQSDVAASLTLGANSYIVKPVSFDAFLEAIKHLGFYWLLLNRPMSL